MLIIGIDPGLTTGLAVADESGVRLVVDIDAPEVPREFDHIASVFADDDVIVYMETGPTIENNARSVVEAIEREVDAHWDRVCRVPPSTWKPHPRAKDLSGDGMGTSRHTKDALGIASYGLWKEGV